MAIAQSRLTTQEQISIPAEIRRRLGIGPGAVLEWDQVGEQIVVRRAGQFTSEDIHRALASCPTACPLAISPMLYAPLF